MEPREDPVTRRRALAALALLVPAPTFAIVMNMVLFPGPVGMTAWTLSKVWILALPFLWVWRVEGERLRFPAVPWSRGASGGPGGARAGLGAGVATGLAASAAILAADRFLFTRWVDPAGLRAMVADNGLDRPAVYAAMALYTCLFNSLLEEYVWRWFVTAKCAVLLPRAPAVLASAAAFTLHHTVILQTQFRDAGLTLLGSAGVFAAGAAWSWLYLRHRSIWSPWLSHAIVDVAVFLVGARLVFGWEWPI